MSPPSELFAIDVPDLMMIAHHTAGVHAHYTIYKMCRALALAWVCPCQRSTSATSTWSSSSSSAVA
jgi:hypothetical protein